MRDQLRGSVRINVEGRGLYGFINELHRSGVNCFEQYVKGSVFSGLVSRRDLRRVEELCEERGLELRSFEYDTLSSQVIKRRSRIGLIVGAFLVIAAYLYFSSVVVTIDIRGNDRIEDSVITAALDELGVRRGTPFREIDCVCTENKLLIALDDLAWVGIYPTGHRLVVEVMETVEKPEMAKRTPCSIVAAHDGVIDSTSVLDGMLMHKVGDPVRAGDVLINGVISDDTGHTTLHRAMGSVTGYYSDSAEFRCRMTQESCVPDGRPFTRRTLELFSLDIPLYFGGEGSSGCRCETFRRPLGVFGKQLPIALRTKRCTKLSSSVTELTEEQAREQLSEKIFLYEKNFLSGCEIIQRRIEESSADGEMVFTVTYRLKGELGEAVEILVKPRQFAAEQESQELVRS